NAEDAEFLYKRGLPVMRFNLLRVDVLSARKDNNVFAPACNCQVTFVIDESQISGVKPAIPDDLCSVGVVAVVTFHNQRSADRHFSDTLIIRRVDANGHTTQWFADRSNLVLTDRSNRSGG